MPTLSVRPRSGLRLRQILPDARFLGDDDVAVRSCCSHSNQCQPGDVFVAVLGSSCDGHDYAAEAVRRGASAIVAERPLPYGVPTCVVDDTRVALGQICQAVAGHPSEQMKVVGVSGTHGKTTTSMLITSVLETAGNFVGVISSIGYCDGANTVHGPIGTPSTVELADWLGRMAGNGCSHAVVEIDSCALARRRLSGVGIESAVLTNVRRGNLDYHGTLLNYRRAKERLFSHLRTGGVSVINADDPASKVFLSKVNGPVLTIGLGNSAAEVTATVLERHKSEQTFLLSAGTEMVPVRTHLIGDHQIYNCLCAAAIGLLHGIDLPMIARGLESVTSLPGRLERVECGQPFGVFVDESKTPDTLATALKTLRRLTDGRVFCIFGASADGDRALRPLLGRVAERLADITVVTSDNPGAEEPLSIAHDILDGFDHPGSAQILPVRARAIQWAVNEARKGDTILIAGKGQDSGQQVGDCVFPFDDRDAVRYCLQELNRRKDIPQLRLVT